jgi:type I site-specific restriction endonuclease
MSNESERATRRSRIDPKLQAAGWKVVPSGSLLATSDDGLAVECVVALENGIPR